MLAGGGLVWWLVGWMGRERETERERGGGGKMGAR